MSVGQSGIGMTSQRTRNRLAGTLEEMGIKSAAVLKSIESTPRHLFVDEALASRAYDNTALPIGFNQTISQPYIVARMVEAVAAEGPLGRVLEIGTGCGYQAVILAQFAKEVYTLERINSLLMRARERFYALKYNNIRAIHADGTDGWPEYAPYDAIIVSAATVEVPDAWRQQLVVGGKLVTPVGGSQEQKLLLITRMQDRFAEQLLDWVSFVPLLEGMDD